MEFIGTKYGGWYVPKKMELNENSINKSKILMYLF